MDRNLFDCQITVVFQSRKAGRFVVLFISNQPMNWLSITFQSGKPDDVSTLIISLPGVKIPGYCHFRLYGRTGSLSGMFKS